MLARSPLSTCGGAVDTEILRLQSPTAAGTCWGFDDSGRCGQGTSSTHLHAVDVPGLSGVKDIAAAQDATCVLGADGVPRCTGKSWGFGIESLWLQEFTIAVGGTPGLSVALDHGHACVVGTDHVLRCTGDPVDLSNDATDTAAIPKAVTEVGAVDRLFAGTSMYNSDYCARGIDGFLRCWDSYASSKVILGTWGPGWPPKKLTVTGPVLTASITGSFGCAVAQTGQLWCWGYSSKAGLAPQDTMVLAEPTAIAGFADTLDVAAGPNWGSCIVRKNGEVACGGTYAKPMKAIAGLPPCKAVTLGVDFTCALAQDGRVFCWGHGFFGQLGDGNGVGSATPVQVQGVSDAVRVVAGAFHTCALRKSGQVSCWGNGFYGQQGTGDAWHLQPVVVPAPAP